MLDRDTDQVSQDRKCIGLSVHHDILPHTFSQSTGAFILKVSHIHLRHDLRKRWAMMVSVGAQYSGRLCGPGHDGARTTASAFWYHARTFHAMREHSKPLLHQVRCKGAQWHRIGHGEKRTTGRLLPHEQGGGSCSKRCSPGRRDHRGAVRTVTRALKQAGLSSNRVGRGSEGQRIPAQCLPFSSVTSKLPPSLQPQVAYTQTLLRDGRTCLRATIPELVWEHAQEDVIGEMAKALEPTFAKAGGLSPDELLDRAGGPGVIQKLAVERLMSQALRQVCDAGGGVVIWDVFS